MGCPNPLVLRLCSHKQQIVPEEEHEDPERNPEACGEEGTECSAATMAPVFALLQEVEKKRGGGPPRGPGTVRTTGAAAAAGRKLKDSLFARLPIPPLPKQVGGCRTSQERQVGGCTSVALLHVGHASVCRMYFNHSDNVASRGCFTSSFLVILLFD